MQEPTILALRRVARRVMAADGGGFTVVQTIMTQIAVIALNILTGVITARLLGPEGRGAFAAVTLWPQFLSGACFVGVPAAIIYHVRHDDTASGDIFTAGIIILGALSLLTVAIGLAALPITMRGYDADTVTLARWCVVATLPYVAMALLRQMLVAKGMFAIYNGSAMLIPLFYLLALLVCWGSVGLDVANSAATQIGAVVLIVGWMAERLWHVCRPTGHRLGHWLRALLTYGTRGAVADCLATLSGTVDRLALMSLVSARELGLYAVAYSLSRLMLVLQAAINNVVFPKMAGRPLAEAKTLHDHAFRFVSYAAAAAITLSFLLGEPMLVLLYGPSFAEAGHAFDILIVEAGLGCVAQVIAQFFCSLGYPGYTSWVQLAGFLVVCLLLAILVPGGGIVGAALAMVIAASLRLALLLGGLCVHLKLKAPRLVPLPADLAYLRRQFLG